MARITMKNITVMALFFPLTATTAENRFEFHATDNLDPVFLEQCKAFRNALDNGNLETIKSFTDPDFYAHPGLTTALRKLVQGYRKEVGKPGYQQTSFSLAKLANPDRAHVRILYEFDAGKGHGNSGCTFKRIKGKSWGIMPGS
ncbi:hypothetical protein [Shewanella sp. BC20]|uniref:hypothetical protein n=1 Tax=Shewanella sp. BC20 TaxID=2004459 RepID=UPI000D644214|nr:hypothetical protein [Shewanella sp. BC20]